MCHWRINTFVINALLVLVPVFTSCDAHIPGFMDLRPVGISIEPGKPDTILPGEYSPVILDFNTEMSKQETEGILQINSDTGVVQGDRFWKGKRLYFVPYPPWTAGIRYVLNLSGIIHSEDGRELQLERYISFYAITRSERPNPERFSPADGASTGVSGTAVEIYFSCPMERFSTESAFTLEGVGDKSFEWSDDDRLLRIIPAKPLLPWMTYHWNLKTGAKSRKGVPLAKEFSAQFSTDLDRLLPKVEHVFPAIASGGRWIPASGGIENGLGSGQGIIITFNKAMGENMLRSLRFDPSFSGRTEQLSDKSIVFIPNRDPDPETAYTLIVSSDTKDSGGLKLGSDYRVTFVPDIPFLKTISFTPDNGNASSIGFDGSSVQIPMNTAAQGIFRFTIYFSLPFSAGAKQNAALRIVLNPYFPGALDPVALRSVKWLSDDRIRMEWEGLRAGTADESHFYQLIIPGGKGGVNNGDGMYFKEDQILFVEVIQ